MGRIPGKDCVEHAAAEAGEQQFKRRGPGLDKRRRAEL
jgi:hypothetical protein